MDRAVTQRGTVVLLYLRRRTVHNGFEGSVVLLLLQVLASTSSSRSPGQTPTRSQTLTPPDLTGGGAFCYGVRQQEDRVWERKMTTLPEVGTGGGKGLQDTRKSQRDDSVVKWSPPKRKGNFRYSREE
eukprot:3701267-Rhodomonas_salina.1